MTYVDSKELTPQKKLVSFLDPDSYISVPNLEAMTGADIMVSPDIGLPNPSTELWIEKHIESGALLIQVKIAHDLTQSIEDDRMKNSLSKMLQTGAMPWQCILLFIGFVGYSEESVLINKQAPHGRKMTWGQVDSALNLWQLRGGSITFPLPSGKRLNEKLENYQRIINKIIVDKETERLFYPITPAYIEEITVDTDIDPVTKEWFNAQNLVTITDSRNGMMSFPDMGIERVKSIWEWMGELASLDTFIGSLYNREVLQVSGIGEGLWEKWIRWSGELGDVEVEAIKKGNP